MSPALTLRAIRETPRLGNTTARTRVPGPTTSLLVDKMIVKADIDGVDAELAAIERAQQIDICGIVLCVYACLLQLLALLKAYLPRRGRKLVIESDGLASLRSYFQQTLPQGRASSHKTTDNAYVASFLTGDGTASPTYDSPRYASPPLFPRDRNPGGSRFGSANEAGGPHGIQELGSLVHAAEDPDRGEAADLYKEHMVVVDGWSECMRNVTTER